MGDRQAVIIGAGPAGLTAAYELLQRTDVKPVVLEADDCVGGIARTVEYKGNRMDIGGHRFFTKIDRVHDWWLKFLPLQSSESAEVRVRYQGRDRIVPTTGDGPDPERTDRVMLVRPRKSRILWRSKLFDYPLTISVGTMRRLGPATLARAGLSYARSTVRPIKPETSLEDFLINRFGRFLYNAFFKSYTEKVWGTPCEQISADWGAQRIKGLSVWEAAKHALRRDRRGEKTQTSLIEQFMYPKLGPGQLWDLVADDVVGLGGRLLKRHRAVGFDVEGERIRAVRVADDATGAELTFDADFVFSSMPVPHLLHSVADAVSPESLEVARGLAFRDFLTVGLLTDTLKLHDAEGGLDDNWIYIQEPGVAIGRLQIFNNWSPYLVRDPAKTWLGLEYFCNEGDALWSMTDDAMIEFGAHELVRLNILEHGQPVEGCVVRSKKAYPAYFGTYDRFDVIRAELERFENLACVGRNGQHRYNNQDHSMLASMVAVDNLAAERPLQTGVWDVNTEGEYLEDT
jgi:protoporphyrinogen oxidase